MKRVAIPLQQYLGSAPGQIVVGSPLYKQLPVTWFYNWMRMDKERCVGLVSVEGIYLPMAMAAIVKTAFDKFPNWDRLVVMEHDMIPPLDAFGRMGRYTDEHDVVGSVYFMHEAPHKVMALMETKPLHYEYLPPDVTRRYVEAPGLYEVDAVAMGFTAIRRRVFEEWDPEVPMWEARPPMAGHDVHFCHEARKQGFRIWVDSAIRCGHLTETAIDYSHSEAVLGI